MLTSNEQVSSIAVVLSFSFITISSPLDLNKFRGFSQFVKSAKTLKSGHTFLLR